MPVRTRSQRLAEEEGSDSNGSAPVITQSTRKRPKKASRRSARLAKKQQSKEDSSKEEVQEPPKPAYPTEEAKSEEIEEPQITTQPTEIYEDDDDDEFDQDLEEDDINSNRSNVEDLRTYVQNYLETPDRPQIHPQSRIQHMIEPSPRVDAITLNNQRSKIEFLVPPRKQEEPMEIRQQVRNLLSPDNVPVTTQQLDPSSDEFRATSRSPSLPFDQMSKYGDKLRQDKTTRLWSPYAPSFDKEQADRTSRLLLTLMIVIAIAVGIKIYQTEIIDFLKPIVANLKQFVMGLLNQELNKGSESITTDETLQQEENGIIEDVVVDEADAIPPMQDDSVTR